MSEFFNKFYYGPLKIYFSWLLFYGVVKFVFFGKLVMSGQWDSTFGYFAKQNWVQAIYKVAGVLTPIVFLLSHFIYYIVMHTFAVLLLFSFELNMLMCVVWLLISFYNGANFYMESFSRKYEVQLAKLKQFEMQVGVD